MCGEDERDGLGDWSGDDEGGGGDVKDDAE